MLLARLRAQVPPTLRAAAYLFGGGWIALPVAILLPLGVALGVGLMPVLVGFPIAAATVLGWRFLARLERERVALVLGAPLPSPYRPVPAGSGRLARWSHRLRDLATWRDLVWANVLIFLGFLAAMLAWAGLSLVLALLLAPLGRALAPEGSWLGGHALLWVVAAPLLAPALLVGVGAMIRALAAGLAGLAQSCLSPDPKRVLEARVERLETSRAGAVESADATLRRVERDLHDGAQHRLVSVALSLGLAREQLDRDPAAARELVDSAHAESKRAMAELRDLVRGIHPSILADRGLEAAVPGLAARSPVPVECRVDLAERPGVATETAAYFVVAEALTNLAKHAEATRAIVELEGDGRELRLTVADDGQGGAEVRPGGGLAGLRQRVEALDGRLDVDSPPGEGTILRAVVPCAS